MTTHGTARARTPLALVAVALAVAALTWWLLRGDDAPRAPQAVESPTPSTPDVRETPVAPELPARDASVVRAVDASADAGAPVRSIVARGAWGQRPGEFGHTTESEANPEGPMALAVANDGTVAVMDQRNRRIQRFVAGRAVGEVALPNEAAQDLAWTPGGNLVALDRLGAASVTVYGPDGHAASTIALRGGAIAEGGAVTGVFADARGVYVEREHREVVRVADAEGHEDPARPTLWGRPSRDGAQMLRATIEDRASGVLRVSVASRENGAMDWSTAVPVGAPVLYLAMLDSDAAGRVYVAAATGREGREHTIERAETVVARLDSAGAVDGTLRLPPLPGGDEVFRPMCVDDRGAVYVMVPGRDGLEVARYEFPR